MPFVERVALERVEAAAAIIEEYYESIGVVVRDDRETIAGYVTDDQHSAIWLALSPTETQAHTDAHAQAESEVVGCVLLRPLPEVSVSAAEVKRLYVRPSHRRTGLASALMDALEARARETGKNCVYLDTKDDLCDAIRFYERRGYSRCERYNDNPQATIFMRKLL